MITNDDDPARLRQKVSDLLDLIEEVAMIADGHRRANLRDAAGNNVALSAILALTSVAIGKAPRLRETGTIFASPGTVIREEGQC